MIIAVSLRSARGRQADGVASVQPRLAAWRGPPPTTTTVLACPRRGEDGGQQGAQRRGWRGSILHQSTGHCTAQSNKSRCQYPAVALDLLELMDPMTPAGVRADLQHPLGRSCNLLQAARVVEHCNSQAQGVLGQPALPYCALQPVDQ
jgi:hypothetical protein